MFNKAKKKKRGGAHKIGGIESQGREGMALATGFLLTWGWGRSSGPLVPWTP